MDKGLTRSYARENDVLYLAQGSPRPAISEERGEGVLVGRDPHSGEIVGWTVIDFDRRFRGGRSSLALPRR